MTTQGDRNINTLPPPLGEVSHFVLFLYNIYSSHSLNFSARSICQGWTWNLPPQRRARAGKGCPRLGTASGSPGPQGQEEWAGLPHRAVSSLSRSPLYPWASHGTRHFTQWFKVQTGSGARLPRYESLLYRLQATQPQARKRHLCLP